MFTNNVFILLQCRLILVQMKIVAIIPEETAVAPRRFVSLIYIQICHLTCVTSIYSSSFKSVVGTYFNAFLLSHFLLPSGSWEIRCGANDEHSVPELTTWPSSLSFPGIPNVFVASFELQSKYTTTEYELFTKKIKHLK